MIKTLFLIKRREDYSVSLENYSYPSVASGMFNSASFVSDMLSDHGIPSSVVTVIDNNCIDKEVTKFKPSHVFIEGYWVIPEKFDILKKLHPNVIWIVRCHSELPFLSQEGVAMDWTFGYLERGILISANSPRMRDDFMAITEENIFSEMSLPLLPNYYPTNNFVESTKQESATHIDIACFGALRPMKNQLAQAVAAITYANHHSKVLKFHVNSGRIEMQGGNAIKNIKALFKNTHHELVEHTWTSHEEFLKLLANVDLSMQVSFTETFNIVTADALSVGTPSVVSSEVPYVYPVYAEPTSTENMVKTIGFILKHKEKINKKSVERLKQYNENSKFLWLSFLTGNDIPTINYSLIEKDLLAPSKWKQPIYKFLAMF